MFNEDFNIIVGGRKSGKTLFLFELATVLKSIGYKLCFIGGTDEMPIDDDIMSCFELSRILSSSKSKEENKKTMSLIKEKAERDKYDFILIDDIDWVRKSVIRMMKDMDVTKICTCVDIPELIQDSIKSEIESNYNDQTPYCITTVGNVPIKEFIKSLIRDQKIKKVIK